MSLNRLRVLLVDTDAHKSQIISSRLAGANHTVLPLRGLEEASEALCNQKFDAVVLGSRLPADGVAEFTGKLRTLEMNQRASSRTAIFSISPDLGDGSGWQLSEDIAVDGFLSERFEAEALMTAVASLARAVCSPNDSAEDSVSSNLPIFEPEKFKEQVAYDRDLLIEIIDLFLTEQLIQIREMQDALTNREYDRLYLTAHTIKGSLASLHAAVGRLRAEELESAAKDHNQQHCEQLLSVLKRDLQTLEPALLQLRESSSSI
jgi:HPt (histidine-containing phosphotransfer) domain-containing protein/CheY-like chemotaxis protein